MTDQELARALFEAGLLTQEQVQSAASQRVPGRNFAQTVVQLGWVTPAQIAQFDPNALGGQPPMPTAPSASGPWQSGSATAYSGTPNVQTSSPPPNAGVVDTGSIGEGWEMVQTNLGTWIGATVVAGIIAIIYSQLTGLITNRLAPDPTKIDPSNLAPYFAGLVPAMLAGNFLGIPLNAFIYGGFTVMGLNQLRKGTASIGDLFQIGPYFVAILIYTVIFSIASISYAFCCIPGLIIHGLMMFALPLIIERNMNPLEAISTSFNTLKGQTGSVLVLMILLVLLLLVSAIPCGLGLLVTYPIWIMTEMALYNRFFPAQSNTPQDQPNYPPPPIPSPF